MERRTVDMLALGKAVAAALTDIDAGETWSAVAPVNEDHAQHWGIVRRTEDGAGIYLSHDAYGGRVRVGGEFPEGFRPYKQEHITVSDNRPGSAIAGDIRRRLFPWYLPEFAKMAAQRDESVRRDGMARQLADELAAIFGGSVYQPQQNGRDHGYVVNGCGDATVSVSSYGEVAHFSIDAKGERARALARFLAAPAVTGERTESDRAYIDAARRLYAMRSDNDVEVDDNAVVSEGETGAFVAAWVHVRREDAPLAGEYDAEDGEVAP